MAGASPQGAAGIAPGAGAGAGQAEAAEFMVFPPVDPPGVLLDAQQRALGPDPTVNIVPWATVHVGMQAVLYATPVPGANYLTALLSQLMMLASNGLFIKDPRCLDLAISLHGVHPRRLGALVEYLVGVGLSHRERSSL